MALTVDIADKDVQQGDTKRLTIIPREPDSTAMAPTKALLRITPDEGDAEEYALNPTGTQKAIQHDEDGYYVNHHFDEDGTHEVYAEAQDAAGNKETTSGDFYVDPH